MARVVVIDDEELVGELTGSVLMMKGHEVRVANSGAAGLQMIHELIPDAVVCDVRMPGMSGEEVIHALRTHPATRHVPVLLMSGQCDPTCARLAEAFLQKPFNVYELLATLERLCNAPVTAA